MDGVRFLALGLLCLPLSMVTPQDEWDVLGVVALAGLLMSGVRLRRLFRRGQDAIVSNVFLSLTLTFTLFFLFGPLLHVFGPSEQAEYAREWFPVNAAQAVYLFGANQIGFGIALCVGELVRWRRYFVTVEPVFHGLPRFSYELTVYLFLIVGSLFKLYVLYNDLVLDRIISGLFRIGMQLALAGIFLYAFKSGLRPRLALVFVLIVTVLYSLTGVIEFSKTETLLPLMALMGGMLAQRVTAVRLLFSAVVLGAALVVLQPLNLEARNATLRIATPTFQDRMDIINLALTGDFEKPENTMGAWARLDYTSPQRAAVHLYNSGDGGRDWGRIAWVFVPRFLFPGKPIITGSSVEFTYKIRRIDTSATAMGVFINGYYNLGWLGLILFSAMVGLILSWYRGVLEAARRADSIILLCVGLMGHLTAILVSGTFAANFIGPFVTMFYLVSGIYVALSSMARRTVQA